MFQVIFILVSVLLVAVILLQQKNSSLGSMMGMDANEDIVQTRRGGEKLLHQATIVLSALFIGLGLYAMFF